MYNNLTDKYIADTYNGLLHIGENMADAEYRSEVYTGNGIRTSLTVGRYNGEDGKSGVRIYDKLVAGEQGSHVVYPVIRGNVGEVLVQGPGGELKFDPLDGDGGIYAKIIDMIYPVGCIYLTTHSANPKNTFKPADTKWERVAEGLFLVGAGTGKDQENAERTFSPGERNQTGNYWVTLTTSQMPNHTHTGYTKAWFSPGVDDTTLGSNALSNKHIIRHQDSGHSCVWYTNNGPLMADGLCFINDAGGGGRHENCPPSYGVYVWKRIE